MRLRFLLKIKGMVIIDGLLPLIASIRGIRMLFIGLLYLKIMKLQIYWELQRRRVRGLVHQEEVLILMQNGQIKLKN